MDHSATALEIIEAAQELAQTRGYNGFSYQDIAERVGIRTASIHYHFPSKGDLGKAALRLARAIVEARGHVSDADVGAAHDAGLSDAEIAEVTAHVALNVFTNYFNSLAGTEVDFPAVQPPQLPWVARRLASVA